MSSKQRNAIILAAGTSSRFVPLSTEIPKGLLEVKGEVLIERQIRQLKEAGIEDITVVVGYKAEMFQYLSDLYGVSLILNEDYNRYNNTSSLIRVLDKLGDTYICSSDNYFPENVFLGEPEHSFYSALYAEGETDEYCLFIDSDDNIVNVQIGGMDSWYMNGHVYFSDEFSRQFKKIFSEEYVKEEVRHGYWEDVYIKHIDELPFMAIKRYSAEQIHEFDSIDELREFDSSYFENTRSKILKDISHSLGCKESSLTSFKRMPLYQGELQFSFEKDGEEYLFRQSENSLVKI